MRAVANEHRLVHDLPEVENMTPASPRREPERSSFVLRPDTEDL
jgi:hypothetical protein